MKVNYEKDCQIDLNALDLEWSEHSEVETKYIQLVSELRKEKNLLHEEVKTIRSELIREANEDPQTCCDKKKPNGADIEAYYRTHKDYKAVKSDLIEAEDAYQVAQDMKDMMHFTKTKALENMVVLHGQQYFAGPSTPRNLTKEQIKRKKNKKASSKIGKSMKRK